MKLVQYSTLEGTLRAPDSKSVAQRLIAIALLSQGKSQINYQTLCDDSLAALNIATALGAQIVIDKNSKQIIIIGADIIKPAQLSCHESALCLRMFTPIAALAKGQSTLTGTGTLLTRPIGNITEVLKNIGALYTCNNNYLPLSVEGPLIGGITTVDGGLTSQFVTGLLLALTRAPSQSEIRVRNLTSKAYINLTIKLAREAGFIIEQLDSDNFIIPGKQTVQGKNWTIEGDWSAAAFLLVAGAVAGNVKIQGLNLNSAQADKKIIDVLQRAGAYISITENHISCKKQKLQPFVYDSSDSPDLFPPLVSLAASIPGESIIIGTSRLIHKESNRAITLQQEFNKIGIPIEIKNNALHVFGGGITGGKVNSHNDHRIAMALSVAGLISPNGVCVEEEKCISKSYPDFYKNLIELNAKIT